MAIRLTPVLVRVPKSASLEETSKACDGRLRLTATRGRLFPNGGTASLSIANQIKACDLLGDDQPKIHEEKFLNLFVMFL